MCKKWMKKMLALISRCYNLKIHPLALCFFLACGNMLSAAGPTDPHLTITKNVSYPDQACAQLGDTVTFKAVIINMGNGVASAPWFIDPLPSGLIFEPGSALVSLNGANFVPGGDPTVGFALPTMQPGDIVRVTFRATVATFPTEGNHFQNIAEVVYCLENDNGCTTVEAISDPIDILFDLPHPVGCAEVCRLIHRKIITLTITWDIPFTNIQSYRIFFDGNLVAEVPGHQSLFFQACLKFRCDASRYSVQAVYEEGSTTPVTPVRI